MASQIAGFQASKSRPSARHSAAGPWGYPGVGVLPRIALDPVGFLMSSAQQYGSIFKLPMGFTDAYVLSHPDQLQHIVQERNQNYIKGRLWTPLRMLLGNGVGVSEGSFWLRQRRMMQPQFHAERLSALAAMLSETIADGLTQWRPLAEQRAGSPIDLVQEMGKIALTASTKALLGGDLPVAAASEICRAVHQALDTMFLPLLTHWAPSWVPVPGAQRFKASIRAIDRAVYELIEQRRRDLLPRYDLLSLLLSARDSETGRAMTDQQLRDEVVTMFLASYEPVVTTLSWAWILLGQHPAVEHRLREEVRRVLGTRLPTAEDLGRLPYTKSVLQETLRLYPPVWLLIREAAESDVVGGVAIPAGATVLGFTYGVHRDPRFWHHPESFDPERFLGANAAAQRRYSYLPFGAGAHKCIGEHYALMEAQLFLTLILQNYQVRITPGQRIRPRATFTLRPGSGVLATLQPA